MKKIIFYAALLAMVLLIAVECGNRQELARSWIDYVNVLFCNSALSEAYGRPDFDLKILMFNTLFAAFGVAYTFEQINLINKGFGSLAIVRFDKSADYLRFTQKQCFRKIVTYLAVVAGGVLLVLLACNSRSFIRGSEVIAFSVWDIRYVIFFMVKLLFLFKLIGVAGTFLLIDYKYEMLLSISMVVVVLLLFLDTRIGSSFVNFSLDWKQVIFGLAYIVLYAICYKIISIRLKYKEMW